MSARRLIAAAAIITAIAVISSSAPADRVDAVASPPLNDGCRSSACRARVLLRLYRAHPMPRCTWEPESDWDPATGQSFHGRPWAHGRYRVVNQSSGAGGKFQMMPATWRSVGGAGLPQHASRVLQERLARRLKRRDGTRPWVRC